MRLMLTAIAIGVVLAAPAAANNDLSALLSGSEVRRSSGGGGDTRFDVWRLMPDGTLSGNYLTEYRMRSGGGWAAEGQVTGRWSVENEALCIEGRGLEFAGKKCYSIRQMDAAEGRKRYSAASVANGDSWELYVYPGARG